MAGRTLGVLDRRGFVGKRWSAATDTASARDARGRALSRRGRAGESPCLSPRPRQEVVATGSTGLGGGGRLEHNGIRARLGNERPQAAITNRGGISNVVLRLLSASTTTLIKFDVSHDDAISLVGRALFTRFLGDRNLLPEGMSEPTTAAGLFDAPEVARKTSDWLNAKFNGNLLPLSVGIFEMLPAEGYRVLGNVLRRAPDNQLFLGWEEKWDNLDFAHIPVGILSQAYELHMRKHAPNKQKREGSYFTPGGGKAATSPLDRSLN